MRRAVYWLGLLTGAGLVWVALVGMVVLALVLGGDGMSEFTGVPWRELLAGGVLAVAAITALVVRIAGRTEGWRAGGQRGKVI